jgi:hypothetical protein
MEIPNIGIRKNQIRELNIPPVPDYLMTPSYSLPVAPSVTLEIGTPIVNVPGCVETHEANNGSKTLQSDDPNGTLTFCDGNVPSFNPIEYSPNQMLPTQRPKVDTRQPKAPEAPDLPIPKTPPATAKVDCPTAAQAAKEPVGTYLEGFRKKVTDYQLIGNQCIQITEKVSIPEQVIAGLPSAGSVVTTGGIAVVATASALMAKPLADVLLKVIKPTVKKVMKKIATIRGKTVPLLSVAERRDLQRERTEAIRALKKVLKPKG